MSAPKRNGPGKHVFPVHTEAIVKLVAMTTNAEGGGWFAFADAVKRRRGSLGLSQRDVYTYGGPSPATLMKVENTDGTGPRPGPKTLARFDHALQWSSGTAYRVFEGQLSPDAAVAARTRATSNTGTDVEAALDPARMIIDYGGEIISYLMSVSTISELPDSVRQHGEELTNVLSDFYVTMLLERFGGPGKELPDHIRASILPALTAPEPARETPDYYRWAYRRWLAGLNSNESDTNLFSLYWDKKH